MATDQPPEAPVADDVFGDDIDGQIAANDALLKGLKYEYGQALLAAQNGEAAPPSPQDLVAIKKVEAQIANDRMFAQARRLTRHRSQGGTP